MYNKTLSLSLKDGFRSLKYLPERLIVFHPSLHFKNFWVIDLETCPSIRCRVGTTITLSVLERPGRLGKGRKRGNRVRVRKIRYNYSTNYVKDKKRIHTQRFSGRRATAPEDRLVSGYYMTNRSWCYNEVKGPVK